MSDVLPGDKLYSRDWNDVLRDTKRANSLTAGGKGLKAVSGPGGLSVRIPEDPRKFVEPAIVAQAYNASGGALDMWQPVTITSQVYSGSDGHFRRVLIVNVPASGDEGFFAICAAPIGTDKVGRVYIAGICLVMLSNPDAKSKCEISDGLAYLIGDDNGSAQVLWEEGATDPGLALIRFPFGGTGGTSDVKVADIASTANLTLSGSSGSIDGITKAGKIILVKDQTTASENGLYQIPASGTAAWTKIGQPKCVEVITGTQNKKTRWDLVSANTYEGGVGFYA